MRTIEEITDEDFHERLKKEKEDLLRSQREAIEKSQKTGNRAQRRLNAKKKVQTPWQKKTEQKRSRRLSNLSAKALVRLRRVGQL